MINVIAGNQPDVARSTCRKKANRDITLIPNCNQGDRVVFVLSRVANIGYGDGAQSNHINKAIAGDNVS